MINPTHSGRKLKVGPNVSTKIESLLFEYKDVFALFPHNMTCVSPKLIMHKLN